MLILILSHLIHASLSLPIPPNDSTQSNDSTRTVAGIVLSCLTTMFACTWTSVHPNIPARELSGGQRLWLRVKIFIITLIFPELIVGWALIQFRCSRLSVKKIREEFDTCSNLTHTHGMFLVMGGFVLGREGEKGTVLQEPQVIELLRDHKISFPGISKDEIRDRSKADGLGKLVAMSQTTWFITQVISRAVQHLPITELELTTVAFALLNVLIYVLWWNKPKDVRFPVMVPLLEEKPSSSPHSTPSILAEGDNVDTAHLSDESKDSESFLAPSLIANESETSSIEWQPFLARDSSSSEQGLLGSPCPTIVVERPRIRRVSIHSLLVLLHRILNLPSKFIKAVGSGLWDFILTFGGAVCDPSMGLDSRKHDSRENVPIFYGGFSEEASDHYFGTQMCIGALFGSIHCFAWAFIFPSTVEQQLWRIMSLCITFSPLVVLLLTVVNGMNMLVVNWKWVYSFTNGVAVIIMAVIYPIARMSTFVLAFLLLRDLPAGTLIGLQWSKFVPHV